MRRSKLVLDALLRVHRELGTTVTIITHNAVIGDMGTRRVRLAGGRIASDERVAHPVRPEDLQW